MTTPATSFDEAELRRRIRSAIEAELGEPPATLILYGSRARGDATDTSDWDVMAIADNSVDPADVNRAMHRLSDELTAATGERISIIATRWCDADASVGLLRNVARDGRRL